MIGRACGAANRTRSAQQRGLPPPLADRVLMLLASGLACPLALAGQAPELPPDWVSSFERGVEWCEPVGGDPPDALLLCTRDAKLDVLDLRTGESRLPAPIDAQPGVQFAGESGGVAYCFARDIVYAIALGPRDGPSVPAPTASGPARGAALSQPERGSGAPQPRAAPTTHLLWKAGQPLGQTTGRIAGPTPRPTDADPEFLLRIVAAQATPAGVLMVRSDGRVAELAREDGRIRWQRSIDAVSASQVHVRGAQAAVVWRVPGGGTAVAFAELRSDAPDWTQRGISGDSPIWTGLADGGLVAVGSDNFCVIGRGCAELNVRLHSNIQPAAASTALCFESEPCPAAVRPRLPLLILQTVDASLCAFQLNGELWWPTRDELDALPAGAVERLRSLTVCGAYLVAVREQGFQVYCSTDGTRVLEAGRAARVLSVCAQGQTVFALYAESADDPGRLELARYPLSQTAPTPQEPRQFRLRPTEGARQLRWPAGRLVLVEDKQVRVYTLP